ncbi:MAG TPA: HAD family hydrolase [Polyangia bacterium]|nr:HAD family hydrolase [Polyangia bacterium]
MTPAAFFDMDRTLIRANTGTLYIRYLRRRGEIGAWRMVQALGWIAQYKLAILDMESVITRVTAQMAGDSEQEMIDKCLEFTSSHVLPTVAPKALEALERHRAEGHVVAILSSSSPYVTEPLAKHLGIEHVLCTRLAVRDGKFAGTHVRPACYGAGKVHWAEAFARDRGVDLARSYFYTDSYSDLPMLERVGVARVINPDSRLKRHARRVGWEVDEW